jgi:ATP synthase protein I
MKDQYKAVGSWGTLGLEIALSIMFGLFGGQWLDGKLGTAPWLAVLGFFFGCGAAVKALIRTTKEMQAIAKREEKQHGNPQPSWERPSEREREKERNDDERS